MPSTPQSVHASIVTVGDELLSGRTVDTNAAWLGRALGDLGLPVVRRHTVADAAGEIRAAVADAMRGSDLVVVTGGLGPTPDDLTRDAVAEMLGRPLRVDAEILASIRTRFRERGARELPAPNRRVAEVPEGARKLRNPVGTAPGLALDTDAALIVLLPGVPREMKAIFSEDAASLIRERFGGRLRPVHTRTLHTSGIPESLLSRRIGERLPVGTHPIKVAFLPDEIGVDIRLTAEGLDAGEAEHRFDDIESALSEILTPWRFEAPGGDLAEAVTAALLGRGKTLGVAESCTGGLVAKRLTDLDGASRVLVGGVVAYADSVKTGMLGVDPADLASHGAVSESVVRRMALGVAEALGADAGIGITGIAGPGGGTESKPVGTVWYAAALDGKVVARVERFPGDRRSVRERSAQAALMLLLRVLEGRPPGSFDDARG